MGPAEMGRSASTTIARRAHDACMHEVGDVGGAIAKVIRDWPKSGKGGQLELEIRDATRFESESVALDAAYYLVDHGYGSTTFTITTNDLHCTQCGELADHTSPSDSTV